MRAVFLAVAALAAAAPGARAQQPSPPPPVDQPSTPPAERPADTPAEKKSPPVTASADGFVIQSESGDFRLQLRGYAQLDGRFYPGDEALLAVDSFLLRRVRPILAGAVGKYFEFNIAPDFGGGTTVLQDAYLDVKFGPQVRLRAGKFKPPVGLERLQSATNLAFVERALPTALVPNRDVGLQLSGELAGGVVAYGAALTDGAPDGGSVDADLADGKDVAGRLFLSPWKRGSSWLKDLGFGVAATTGTQTGVPAIYRSGGQLPILTPVTGTVYDGRRTRFTPQLSFYSGRLGLLAEYASSESDVRQADGTTGTFELSAWQVTSVLLLTSDRAAFAGVRPQKPFDPGKGQWGALELAARVNGLDVADRTVSAGLVDPTRSVSAAFAWGLGVNWWLTRNVKQQLSYERTTFTDGAPGGADRDAENALFIRTQVSF